MTLKVPRPQSTDLETALNMLRAVARPDEAQHIERWGIVAENALGVRMPDVRMVARKLGKQHTLALQLWDSGIHEAQILAGLVADPALTTPELMDAWTSQFRSWDTCDQACTNLFRKLPFAEEKALAYTRSKEEFIKRTGFTLMAVFAVHGKKAPDAKFITWLPVIEREACDNRNFVKKAVNWALRQIGKRNPHLCGEAIRCAERILLQDTPSARWIAKDALREFEKKLPLLEAKEKAARKRQLKTR